MGVYTVANIVKKENDKVVLVEGQEIPVCDPLHALTKLIFLDEYKNSLFDISETEVDLSFFTTMNEEAYGQYENVHASFSPKEVLKSISQIREAFLKNADKFIYPFIYTGVYDSEDKRLSQVMIELKEGGFPWSKKTVHWGNLNINEDKAFFQWYDDENKKWGDRIDLAQEKPRLFRLIYQGQEKIKGEKLDYKLKKQSFYETIEPELNDIETLAIFAEENNYELQMTQS